MRRRQFITLVGSAAASWPFAARAQQTERVRQIAYLVNAVESSVETQGRFAAFRKGLNALGAVEGQNIRIETRWGGGNPDRVRTYARELVQLAPDVIVTNGTPSTAAVQRETSSIPIVFAIITDPVGDGFAASLSRPGGKITGFSAFNSEMGGKWVELLKEIAPGVTRAALLFNPRTAPVAAQNSCGLSLIPRREPWEWNWYPCRSRALRRSSARWHLTRRSRTPGSL